MTRQSDDTDPYDLSGEKAAAEALKREDAFKELQLQEKAQQTKDFFAEQDRKQQEAYQETQRLAEAQLAERSQKEFWEAKQAEEARAAMEKELSALHVSAQQEHQQWRADFTQGICRDDVAAVINGQIEAQVGAYQERLSDLGSNSQDSAAMLDKYKGRLESDASTEIENRTAELHQQYFPEYQGLQQNGPSLAPGEIPSSGFGPFEAGPQGGYAIDGLVNKKGDFGPWEAGAGPDPDKPFMRPEMDPRGDGTDAPEGWFKNVDELPKQDAPPGWFKNIDAPPADGKDIPDGWMKPIDPPIGEQLSTAMNAAAASAAGELRDFGKFAKETALNPEAIHLTAEHMDHVHEAGVIPGLPHDVASQLGEQFVLMREHGLEGLKAAAQLSIEQAKEFVEKIGAGAAELAANLKYSSSETLDRLEKATAGPQTENNKLSEEIHQHDVAAEKSAANARLEDQLRQRELDLGKSAAEIESKAAHFASHAKEVDQQMQPPPPQPVVAEIQAASPVVTTVPAEAPGPPVVIPPSTPAVAPITPSMQLG